MKLMRIWLMYPGVESGTIKALYHYLTNYDDDGLGSFPTTLSVGLAAGIVDLSVLMTADDVTPVLAILYDLSSHIKLPFTLPDELGGGDSLQGLIDFIGGQPPVLLPTIKALLGGILLQALQTLQVIEEILGR